MIQSCRRSCENFMAVRGNGDCVFELGGEGFVLGHSGPAVVQHLHLPFADVDHRLDGKEHALFQFVAVTPVAVMQNVGRVVKNLADAVAAEIAYDRITFGFNKGLDSLADIARMRTRLDDFDAAHKSFVSDVDQALCLDADVAAKIHAA